MLIKKQTEKDHTEGRAVYLNAPKDAAALIQIRVPVALLNICTASGRIKPSVSSRFWTLGILVGNPMFAEI